MITQHPNQVIIENNIKFYVTSFVNNAKDSNTVLLNLSAKDHSIDSLNLKQHIGAGKQNIIISFDGKFSDLKTDFISNIDALFVNTNANIVLVDKNNFVAAKFKGLSGLPASTSIQVLIDNEANTAEVRTPSPAVNGTIDLSFNVIDSLFKTLDAGSHKISLSSTIDTSVETSAKVINVEKIEDAKQAVANAIQEVASHESSLNIINASIEKHYRDQQALKANKVKAEADLAAKKANLKSLFDKAEAQTLKEITLAEKAEKNAHNLKVQKVMELSTAEQAEQTAHNETMKKVAALTKAEQDVKQASKKEHDAHNAQENLLKQAQSAEKAEQVAHDIKVKKAAEVIELKKVLAEQPTPVKTDATVKVATTSNNNDTSLSFPKLLSKVNNKSVVNDTKNVKIDIDLTDKTVDTKVQTGGTVVSEHHDNIQVAGDSSSVLEDVLASHGL